jgi:hypothetical protein
MICQPKNHSFDLTPLSNFKIEYMYKLCKLHMLFLNQNFEYST